MIHVIFDTNIYRNNPKRDSLNFKAIEKLAEAKWLLVHVPYIVKREFQTQQREIYLKDLEKAMSGIYGLSRKSLSPTYVEIIEKIIAELESNKNGFLDDSEYQFNKWIERIGGKEHSICLEQSLNALEAYFKGAPPVSAIKERKDIPDSFIFQSVLQIQKEVNNTVHFVVNDRGLSKSFEGKENVKVYNTISEFVESDLVQEELKDLDFLDNMDEIIKALIELEANDLEIESTISSEIGEKVIGHNLYDDEIMSDEHSAIITSCGEAENIKIDFNEASYYGNGDIGLQFSCQMEVYATYYIFKSDYYAMADYEYKNVPSVSDHNDHYFEAEDDFYINIEGVISIRIDRDNMNIEDLSSYIQLITIGIDELIKVNIC